MQLPPATGPNPAALHLGIAQLALRGNRPDQAAQHFMKALSACWWCWEAFEGLCYLGKAPDPTLIYGLRPRPPPTTNGINQPSPGFVQPGPATRQLAAAEQELFTPKPQNGAANYLLQQAPNAKGAVSYGDVSFPSSADISVSSSWDMSRAGSNSSMTGSSKMLNGMSTLPESGPALGSFFTPEPASSSSLPAHVTTRRQGNNKEAVRRSTRLTGSTASAANSAGGGRPTSSLGNNVITADKGKGKEPRSRVASNPRERKRAKASSSPPGSSVAPVVGASNNHYSMFGGGGGSSASSSLLTDPAATAAVSNDPEDWLRLIYTRFGKAEACLSRFESAAAEESMMLLDPEQRRSWRASAIVGRARMEALDYAAVRLQPFVSAVYIADLVDPCKYRRRKHLQLRGKLHLI